MIVVFPDHTHYFQCLNILTGDLVIGGIVGVANETVSRKPSIDLAISIRANLDTPFDDWA